MGTSACCASFTGWACGPISYLLTTGSERVCRFLLLPAQWHGLNERGKALIREMNRLGMVINVSHASDEAMSQAIDVSSDPVMATHHGLREFNDIPRNMPDWLLKKLAAKGGLIGFQIGNEFHNRKVFDWRTQHAGKPFWDTSRVSSSNLSIEQIDKIVAPQFPMLGSQRARQHEVHGR